MLSLNLTVNSSLTGNAVLLAKKRKRKPTQKILEYCLEAEASTGPKKKVQHGHVVLCVQLFLCGLSGTSVSE